MKMLLWIRILVLLLDGQAKHTMMRPGDVR